MLRQGVLKFIQNTFCVIVCCYRLFIYIDDWTLCTAASKHVSSICVKYELSSVLQTFQHPLTFSAYLCVYLVLYVSVTDALLIHDLSIYSLNTVSNHLVSATLNLAWVNCRWHWSKSSERWRTNLDFSVWTWCLSLIVQWWHTNKPDEPPKFY